MRTYRQPGWIALIVCFAMLAAPATAQSGLIHCASNDGRYRYCRAETQNRVRLVNQFSNSRCDYRYSWGYDYRGIWVDRGCRAQFEFGRGGGNDGGGGSGAAVAAGILGGIIVGSAIAGAKSDKDNDDAAKRREYYSDGCRCGQCDWDDDHRPDYQRYRDRFSQAYENDFSAGYNDGYNNKPNRYR
jgi:hypothetical protein